MDVINEEIMEPKRQLGELKQEKENLAKELEVHNIKQLVNEIKKNSG